jgi:hypothetical protein
VPTPSSGRWRQQVPVKYPYFSTKLHGITPHETVELIATVMKMVNLAQIDDVLELVTERNIWI